MIEIAKSMAFYETNYELIYEEYLGVKDKIILGEPNVKICRFCSNSSPEVNFIFKAHVIPESLGNKSLFSTYECDTCNQLFGKGIENDFGNWSKPMRTLVRIKGKKGIPTLKKEGDKGWRIEYDNSQLNIKQYESDPIATINDITKCVTFQFQRDTYTPIAVLKAFVKMGLSVMPEVEISNFRTCLESFQQQASKS